MFSNKIKYWNTTLNYDEKYIIKNKINLKKTDKSEKKIDNFYFQKKDYNKYIDLINNYKDLEKKINLINKLNKKNFFNCDSFYGKNSEDIYKELKLFFKNGEINIVILGAGPCGLYFANSLINNYTKKRVNILFIENRVSVDGFKKPYSRDWLMHILNSSINVDEKIKNILMDLGNKNFIGGKLNNLETLLFLSCKNLNIKFLFRKNYNLDEIINENVTFIINATGNRFNKKMIDHKNYKELSYKNISFANNQFYFNNLKQVQNKEVKVFKSNNFYNLSNENYIANWCIVKIINIPIKKYDFCKNIIEKLNFNENKFFIWKGNLSDDINECLIFINLEENEIKEFININEKLKLKDAIKNLNLTNKKIIYLFKNLLKEDNNIEIEPIFYYSPYFIQTINQKINDKYIINIGDSYFNGDPKLGNGLALHIGFINNLIKMINKFI